VVEVFAAPGYGTGYAVADDLVLTARHVLGNADRHQVRIVRDTDWLPAEVAWTSDGIDAALLRVPAAPWRDGPDSGALRWGRVIGDRPVPCHAHGFPVAQRTGAGGREVEDVRGVIDVTTTVLSGRYSVDITSATPIPLGPGVSAWQGMSGAALLGPGRQLLGVLIEDPLMFGSRRLEAVPATWLLEDTGFAELIGAYTHDVEDVADRGPAVALDSPDAGLLADAYEELPETHGDYQLLQARYHRVPFLGREAELDQLRGWWRGPEPFGVAVVVGDGGAGKSRLAAELCQEVTAAGWSAGVAAVADLAANAAGVDVVWPTLLVVDYVDRLSEPVVELIGRLSRRRRGPRLRILLLDRTPSGDLKSAEWWRDLDRGMEGALRLHTRVTIQLQAGGLDLPDRQRHAKAALRAFGGEPAGVSLPDLGDDGFRNPLSVHLATLLAVRGERRRTADEALAVFVHRERAGWERRLAEHGLGVGDLGKAEAVQAVALATLTTPTHVAAVDLLSVVDGLAELQRTKVSRWLATLFPDADRLAPFAPDLLTEQLLQELGADLSVLVLRIADHPRRETPHLERMLTVLRLGESRPAIGAALHALLTERLDALVGAAAADPQSALPGMLDKAAERVAATDPDGIAAAAARVGHRSPAPDGPFARLRCRIAGLAIAWHDAHPSPARVGALTDLVAYRAIIGDLDGATSAARRARTLAADAPLTAYNLGTCLAVTDRVAEALPLLEEAARHPEVRGDALINLAAAHANAGRQIAAARTFVAAVKAYPGTGNFLELAAEAFGQLTKRAAEEDGVAPTKDPDGFRPPLGSDPSAGPAWPDPGRLLERLASRLAIGSATRLPGTLRNALVPLLFTGFAKSQARYLAEDFSEVLRVLASQRARDGDYEAALVPADESVQLLHRFATGETRQRQMLARNRGLLAHYSARAGKRDDAIRHGREAVAEHRALLPEDPALYTAKGFQGMYPAPGPGLADALTDLAGYLEDDGQLAGAVEVLTEAVELYEAMADSKQAAQTAVWMGLHLARLDRAVEAVEALAFAAEILEEAAAAAPSATGDLADVLLLLGEVLLTVGEDGPSRAVAAAARAVEVTRAPDGEADRGRQVDALVLLGGALQVTGRYEEALDRVEEAVAICRAAGLDPSQMGQGLSLVAMCALYLGRPEQAMAAAREAVEVLADVPATDPTIPIARAQALTVLASRLLATPQATEALAHAQRALGIVDTLLEGGEWGVGLALMRVEALNAVAGCHLALDDPDSALAAAVEARAVLAAYPLDNALVRILLGRSGMLQASALLRLGRVDEAREPFDVAERYFGGPGDTPTPLALAGTAGLLTGKAGLHLDAGEAETAAGYLDRAVALLRGPASDIAGQRAELVRALAFRATARMRLGRPDEALDDGGEALVLLRADPAGVVPDVAHLALTTAGLAYAASGRHDDALPLLEEALAGTRDLVESVIRGETPRSPAIGVVAQTLIGVAQSRAALGDLAGAVEATVTGEDLLGDGVAAGFQRGILHVLRAQCQLMLGEPFGDPARAAVTALRSTGADDLPTRLFLAQALGLVAVDRNTAGSPAEAIEPALEAVALYGQLPQSPETAAPPASLLNIAGQCAAQLGDLPQAAEWLGEAARRFAALPEDQPQMTMERINAEVALTFVLADLDRPADALRQIGETARLAHRLAASAPEYAPLVDEVEGLRAQLSA